MSSVDEITENEYLVREPQAEYKHEYRNGRMVAMSGANEAHNLISVNVVVALGARLKNGPCKVFASDMRVKVAAAHFYTYPDVAVVCGESRFDDRDKHALVNPALIIEVLSVSTESYDRGEKFEYYKKLPSLDEYVLVAQDRVAVDRYSREGESWSKQTYSGLEETIKLASIQCEISVRELYEKVGL